MTMLVKGSLIVEGHHGSASAERRGHAGGMQSGPPRRAGADRRSPRREKACPVRNARTGRYTSKSKNENGPTIVGPYMRSEVRLRNAERPATAGLGGRADDRGAGANSRFILIHNAGPPWGRRAWRGGRGCSRRGGRQASAKWRLQQMSASPSD